MPKELEVQKNEVLTRSRDFSLYSVFYSFSVLLLYQMFPVERDSFPKQDVNESFNLSYNISQPRTAAITNNPHILTA